MDEQNLLLEQLLRQKPDDISLIVDRMVKDYYSAIYRLSCSILADSEEAADATQDTFINATQKLDQYQVGTNFRAWLYTIAVNNCRGYLRKRKARLTLTKVLQTLVPGEKKTVTPEQVAMQSEIQSELWVAVDRMDEKYRLPIQLRVVHNLPVKEIAQIMRIKEKTVYTRLYQGFRLLKVRLGKKGDWDESIWRVDR